jgi:hypothetical protein
METRTLRVDDQVWVGGGYDSDPAWIAAAGDDLGSRGTVLEFIPGQNLQPAAVIKLDDKIILPEGAGGSSEAGAPRNVPCLGAWPRGDRLGDPSAAYPRRALRLPPRIAAMGGTAERRLGRVARNVRLLGPRTAVRRRTRAELLQVLMLPDFARIDMEDAGWS